MISQHLDKDDYLNVSFHTKVHPNYNISAIYANNHDPIYLDALIAGLETKDERKARKRSHYIIFLTIFLLAIGFSIVITGVFPYLKLLENNPQLSKTQLGWVIAANPFGQMLISPLLGYIGNKLGSIRIICYFTMILYCLGNILYGMLPKCVGLWDNSAFHLMMISRLLTGLSSAVLTLCRAYLASSTTLMERTSVMASLSAAISLGYIIGPVIQLILTLLITDEVFQYQAAGYIPAALALFNFILLTPWIFKEFDIAKKERQLLRNLFPNMKKILPRANKKGILSLLVCFFILQFNYVLLETLIEPFVQDQYAWCDELAVVVVGIILTITGVIFLCLFFVSAKLAKKFDERKILIFLGFTAALVGIVMLFPFGPGKLNYCGKETIVTSKTPASEYLVPSSLNFIEFSNQSLVSSLSSNDNNNKIFNKFCSDVTTCLGCPNRQEWCQNVPQLPLVQFLFALFIIMSSFPFGMSMINTLVSKMVGPKPQGTWMGLLTASGSLARMLGPIFVFYIYIDLGTRYVVYMLLIGTILALLTLKIQYKILIPMKIAENNNISHPERY